MKLSEIIEDLDAVLFSKTEKDITEFVDSGSYALNKIISGKYKGGYPIGAITEIWGESAAGKTVFLTHAFIGAQAKDYYAIMLDNEHSYNPVFAKSLGVDNDRLIYAEPVAIEDCFDFIEKTILKIRENDRKTPIVIGLDSVGTTPCRKELEGEIGDNDVIIGALRAKTMGNCLRRINPLLKKHKVCLIIINQLRSKIGVVYGDPRTKAGGGKSLEYYCSVSLEVKAPKSGIMHDDVGKSSGITGSMFASKNKVAIPFQEAEFELLFDKGLSKDYGLCGVLIKDRLVISPKKGYYAFAGTNHEGSRESTINSQALTKIESNELL